MAEMLDNGDVYFLYRPRVNRDRVESFEAVQRLLIILRPWRGPRRFRLLVVGRKRLPAITQHDRVWAFVDAVLDGPDQLRGALAARTYQTKTRGERFQPSSRPVAEGAYVIARHNDHTHLAYKLKRPDRLGAPHRDLNIDAEASHIVAVRNPRAPAPSGIGLPRRDRPNLPDELQDRFRDRRFAPLDPPEFLDHPGVEIVLIGATHDASLELDLDLDAEVERAENGTIFADLRIDPDGPPVEPLFASRWR